MNQLPLSQIIAAASIAAAIACGWLCLRLARQAREAMQHLLAVASQHEGELTSVKQQLSRVSQFSAEQTRRIAWLENNRQESARRAQPVEAVAPAASSFTVPQVLAQPTARLSVTERRHRVLSLARRGLDVGLIATSLGLPHGEVELIIELNKAAAEGSAAYN